jgi:hypothetical protein
MGIHPPAKTCTVPTIITLLRVIPPIPIFQELSWVGAVDALYTGIGGYISSPHVSERPITKSYREKSVSNASNKFRKPLESDFIALPRLVPDLYLALPRFVPRPLGRNHVLSLKRGRDGGEVLTAMRICVEWPPPRGAVSFAPRNPLSPCNAWANGRPTVPLL